MSQHLVVGLSRLRKSLDDGDDDKTEPKSRIGKPATSNRATLSLTGQTTTQAGLIGGQSGQAHVYTCVSTMLVVHKAITTEQTATTEPMTSSGLVTLSWKPTGNLLSSKGAIGRH